MAVVWGRRWRISGYGPNGPQKAMNSIPFIPEGRSNLPEFEQWINQAAEYIALLRELYRQTTLIRRASAPAVLVPALTDSLAARSHPLKSWRWRNL